MTSLKINDKATGIYYLRVPVDAKEFKVNSDEHSVISGARGNRCGWITLEELQCEGEFSILGCASTDSIDEGLKGVVEGIDNWTFSSDATADVKSMFADYCKHGALLLKSWQQSFLSLLKYNGVELKENEKLLIIRKQ